MFTKRTEKSYDYDSPRDTLRSGESLKDTLRSDYSDAKESVLDAVDDAATETRRQLKSMARETGERVSEYLNQTKHQMTNARDTAERTIRGNPFTVTAAAFAGGLLLGRLLTHRK